MKAFISTNAYICVELNAHAIVKFVQICRERNAPQEFVMWVLSSQPCEHLFRVLRSLTTTCQTVINFSVKEFTEKLKRVQFKYNIMYNRRDKLNFPTLDRLQQRKTNIDLPTNAAINDAIKQAQVTAIRELLALGVCKSLVDLPISIGHVNSKSQEIPEVPHVQYDDDCDNGIIEDLYSQEEIEEISPYFFVGCKDIHDEQDSIEDLPQETEFVAVHEKSFTYLESIFYDETTQLGLNEKDMLETTNLNDYDEEEADSADEDEDLDTSTTISNPVQQDENVCTPEIYFRIITTNLCWTTVELVKSTPLK